MEEEQQMYWGNFVTGEYDYRAMPQTDEEAVQYIPQWPAAQNLYRMHRERGLGISEAMEQTLRACVGETQ